MAQSKVVNVEEVGLETINWSTNGPWMQELKLFGLAEFAGFVTTLAMRKQGSDIQKHILPHHIFELQCIIDSMTASMGWLISPFHGHVLEPCGFRPLRDTELFLGVDTEVFIFGHRIRLPNRDPHGFLNSAHILGALLMEEAQNSIHHRLHETTLETLQSLSSLFTTSLGTSMFMKGLKTMPTSRFSNTDANGLWEYSPFLCGVGLAEALEAAYLTGMYVWEHTIEPISIMHLFNMLCKKGYLDRSRMVVYDALERFFGSAFFVKGQPPSSNFSHAYLTRLFTMKEAAKKLNSLRRQTARMTKTRRPTAEAQGDDRLFNIMPTLVALRKARWDMEALPVADMTSSIGILPLRLFDTKCTLDPESGKIRFEDTELVRELRAHGMPDNFILQNIQIGRTIASHVAPRPLPLKKLPPTVLASMDLQDSGGNDIHRAFRPPDIRPWRASVKSSSPDANSRFLGPVPPLLGVTILHYIETDLMMDLHGDQRPLSSINYIWITCIMISVFKEIEKELSKRRNRLYVQAYEEAAEAVSEARSFLTLLALEEQDDECLRVMADQLTMMCPSFQSAITGKGCGALRWIIRSQMNEMRLKKPVQ
ncbi:hypothetical protein VTJ04DRAFT_3166 [Mycothermus thermophilus]|uniref:uncharacterized protein n=1 Tax=Humicola insolens TaxID=85995 RepID=UPI0037445E0E